MSSKPRSAQALPLTISTAELARCEFFSEFTEAGRKKVLSFSSLRKLDSGETLFEEGQPCQALHLLLSGEVKMNKVSTEGKEQVVKHLRPGQIFGAAPLFTPQGVFPATAVALQPSLILSVPKGELIRYLKAQPEMFLKVLAFVSQHLQDMMRLAETVSLETVPKRVAVHLLTLAKREGGPKPGQHLRLGQSQAALAAELGTVREVVGRALVQFEKAGALKKQGRELVLKDVEGLRRFAGE